jgi:hypothetical protein
MNTNANVNVKNWSLGDFYSLASIEQADDLASLGTSPNQPATFML